jgi:hypothetical protein
MDINEISYLVANLVSSEHEGEKDIPTELFFFTQKGFSSFDLEEGLQHDEEEMHFLEQFARYVTGRKKIHAAVLVTTSLIFSKETQDEFGLEKISAIVKSGEISKYPELKPVMFVVAENKQGKKVSVFDIKIDDLGQILSVSESKDQKLNRNLENVGIPDIGFFGNMSAEFAGDKVVMAQMELTMKSLFEMVIPYEKEILPEVAFANIDKIDLASLVEGSDTLQ